MVSYSSEVKIKYLGDFSIFAIFSAISRDAKLTNLRGQNHQLVHGVEDKDLHHVKEHHFFL